MSNENLPFSVGSVVKLKSGGPEMTIEKISIYDGEDAMQAKCVYFSSDKRFEEWFLLDALKDVSQKK